MNVRFLSTADRELLDAFEWYDNQVPGLGTELIVVYAIAHLHRKPRRYR